MIKFKIKHSTLPVTNYIESFKPKITFHKTKRPAESAVHESHARRDFRKTTVLSEGYQSYLGCKGNISTGDKEAKQCPIERNPFGG